MSAKKQNQNTEKNTDTEKSQELTDLYPSMVMDKITLTAERISQLYDLMHKLITNPYHIKDVDRLLNLSVKFKHKIEIPSFISKILFEDIVEITGFELKGSTVFFDYSINGNGEYRYYIDFGASKLITKELILFKLVFERIDYNDLTVLLDALGDFISEIDDERNMVLELLKKGNIKIEN